MTKMEVDIIEKTVDQGMTISIYSYCHEGHMPLDCDSIPFHRDLIFPLAGWMPRGKLAGLSWTWRRQLFPGKMCLESERCRGNLFQ